MPNVAVFPCDSLPHCLQAPSGDVIGSLDDIVASGVLNPGKTKVYQAVSKCALKYNLVE